MNITGKAHKLGDFINTDIHCSGKYLDPGASQDEVIRRLFIEIKPGFSERVGKGDIIAAGEGFGTVSSREDAPTLLRKIGIQAVLAKSFGYLFYRNAINVGLPLVECNTDLINENDMIAIDLQTSVVTNLSSKKRIESKTKYSAEILHILEDGGLINHLTKHGGYAI